MLLELGEDLLLDRQLLEHRLDARSRSRRSRRGRWCPVTRALSRLASSGEIRPLPSSLSISRVHVAQPLVDPLLVEVGDHHRHLEPAEEQQRELAGHQPGPDDADLGDRSGQAAVGRAGGLAARFCTRSKAYRPARSSRAHDQVGQAPRPRPRTPPPVGRSSPRRSARAPGTARGRRRRPCCRRTARPAATAASQASPRSSSGRSTVISPATTWPAQSSDRSRKSAPSNIASAMPSSKACGPVEHPVLAQRRSR